MLSSNFWRSIFPKGTLCYPAWCWQKQWLFKETIYKGKVFCYQKLFLLQTFLPEQKRWKKPQLSCYYQQGGSRPVEDKPIERRYFDENLDRFCINFSKHVNYNFPDSQGLISNFLRVFENVFILQPNLSRVWFKCSFTIINHQTATCVRFVEVTTGHQKLGAH